MLIPALRARAEAALRQALGQPYEDLRLEIVPRDGTMLWFRQLSDDGHDPVQLLRTNAQARVTPLSGPAVLDPDTGRAAKRYAIPYRVWAKPGALRGLLEGGLTMHQHVLDFSAL